mmetsp:Transcript_4860/g.7084  ORF Transcript_4860/g.7084 Transcript_4860/m.7084 type:complete len:220 (+) Transcript_4860:139-798(+)|eukprot:CAMPEP_0202457986 /NCGR_PEP_ID=MMETSP1360-20130828/19120_1 /ASSEMBLY_ACC=CAM_ASM_000848 /TAXON_ID=515479 /ORGANISM="Licmophora paradoxa, Strain CCMP2313" /LENGTH=219 /DNA_ID=CAMNT_0049078255 /DNA_START=91 /DNA_END=750 /DNA_ORIENTATION=+
MILRQICCMFLGSVTALLLLAWAVRSSSAAGAERFIQQLGAPSTSCDTSSKVSDIFSVAAEECSVGNANHPVRIVHQNTDSITFTISQDWTMHEELRWLAVSFDGKGNRQRCSRQENVATGETMAFTAECKDGLAVIDLYIHHPAAADDQLVFVPPMCGPIDERNNCHFRYALKCYPSKCSDNGVEQTRERKNTMQKLTKRLGYGYWNGWKGNIFRSST